MGRSPDPRRRRGRRGTRLAGGGVSLGGPPRARAGGGDSPGSRWRGPRTRAGAQRLAAVEPRQWGAARPAVVGGGAESFRTQAGPKGLAAEKLLGAKPAPRERQRKGNLGCVRGAERPARQRRPKGASNPGFPSAIAAPRGGQRPKGRPRRSRQRDLLETCSGRAGRQTRSGAQRPSVRRYA